ncbi:MAG: hypothetical protein ACFCAD_06730 [Pleurocapsa sp.]
MLCFHAQKEQNDLWQIYCGSRLVKTIDKNIDYRQVLFELNNRCKNKRSLCSDRGTSSIPLVTEIEKAVNDE